VEFWLRRSYLKGERKSKRRFVDDIEIGICSHMGQYIRAMGN